MKVYVLCDASTGMWEYEGVFATPELAMASAPESTEWEQKPSIFEDSEPTWHGRAKRTKFNGGYPLVVVHEYEVVQTTVIGREE